jgi:hypothetical protein
MKQYNIIFSSHRTVLICPDGSSYLINSTTDNEFRYGAASMNTSWRMYEGYHTQLMWYPDDALLISYYNSLSLPWDDLIDVGSK